MFKKKRSIWKKKMRGVWKKMRSVWKKKMRSTVIETKMRSVWKKNGKCLKKMRSL